MKARTQIKKKLKTEGRSMAWLASKIGVTRQHVSLVLQGKAVLTEQRLKAINKALATKFK